MGAKGKKNKNKMRWRADYPLDLLKSHTYYSWTGMKRRCTPTNGVSRSSINIMKHYVGRGITFCDKWKKFSGFLEDMGISPEGLSLDRINNDLNYSKENCRWATDSEQNLNRRTRSNVGHRYIHRQKVDNIYSVKVPPNRKAIYVEGLEDAIYIRDSLLHGFSL